jgi:hypothetical protein
MPPRKIIILKKIMSLENSLNQSKKIKIQRKHTHTRQGYKSRSILDTKENGCQIKLMRAQIIPLRVQSQSPSIF